MHGQTVDGRPLKVDLAAPRPASAMSNHSGRSTPQRGGFAGGRGGFGDAPKGTPTKTIFVGNMSWSTDENTLREYFGEHGDVKSVRIPTDKDTGRVKG
jgi:nucleolin